jgi:drug/metabolite transporter (DMT)-like permease
MSSVTNTLLLVSVAFLLALGQLLLKAGVQTASAESGKATLPALAMLLAVTWQFWAAIMVCSFVVPLWAWILTFIPLSRAYPFVVLAFIFTAIFESVFFGMQISPKFFIGCSFILIGLLVIVA